jgi:ketosteroid isomerase-like protein
MGNEEKIATIIRDWTRAIENRDREGILAKHADDLLMIDFPNTVHGIAAYAKTWDFFDQSRRGEVVFRPSNLKVTAGDHVAFAHCDIHCEGTTAGPIDLRLTTGLVKRGGEWIVTHEHHSMPTENETLIGPDVRG